MFIYKNHSQLVDHANKQAASLMGPVYCNSQVLFLECFSAGHYQRFGWVISSFCRISPYIENSMHPWPSGIKYSSIFQSM